MDAVCSLDSGLFASAWSVAIDSQRMTQTTVFVVSLSKMHFSLFPSVIAYCIVFILALPCLGTRAAREVRDCNSSSLFQTRRTPTLQSPVKMQAPVTKVDFQFFLASLRLVLVSGCLPAAFARTAARDNSDDNVRRRRFNYGNVLRRFSSPSSPRWNMSDGLTDFSWPP